MRRKQLYEEEDFQTSFQPGDTMANISIGNGDEIIEMMLVDFNRMNRDQKAVFIRQFASQSNNFLKRIYGDMTATTKITDDIIKQMQQQKIVTTEDIAKVVKYYKTKGTNMVQEVKYREFNTNKQLDRTEETSKMSIYGGLFQSFKNAGEKTFNVIK